VTGFHVLFLASFIGGLVLAVFAMLHGVEYSRHNRSRAPSPVFNLPAIAAFAVAFGAVGYSLTTRTTMSAWAIILIAVASGAVTTSAMILLLARWALRARTTLSAENDVDEIQGHFAIVLEEIGTSGTGEISYQYHGRTLRAYARSVSMKALPVGSEVVIDRIQDGVAFVEEWASVEQRL
jgi:hypothetical protein